MTRARTAPLLLLACVLAGPPALGGEKPAEPTPAAVAVAALEAKLADLHKEGTAFALRERYEALLAEAAAAAEKHAADAAVARVYWVIARCCEALGKHPEKEAAFARYIDLLAATAKDRAAAELRAEIEALVARRQLFAATKLLQFTLSKFPDGPEAAWALYRLGTCHLWMEKDEDASAALSEVIDRWPKSAEATEARLRLARSLFARRRAAEVIPLLEAYLAGQPKGPQREAVLFDLAMARSLSRDYYGALVGFQNVVREAPQSPYAAVARACIAKLRSDVLSRIGQ